MGGVPPAAGRWGGGNVPTNGAWERPRRDHSPSRGNSPSYLPQAGGQPEREYLSTRLSLRLRRERRRRRSREGGEFSPTALDLPARGDLSLLPPPSFVGRRNLPPASGRTAAPFGRWGRRDQPRREREDSQNRRVGRSHQSELKLPTRAGGQSRGGSYARGRCFDVIMKDGWRSSVGRCSRGRARS